MLSVTPARASDLPTMPAKAIMPKPLPMRQRASRRVSGLEDLCLMGSIDKHEFAGAEQNLGVAAPRCRVVLHLCGNTPATAAAAHAAHHSHAHGHALAHRHRRGAIGSGSARFAAIIGSGRVTSSRFRGGTATASTPATFWRGLLVLLVFAQRLPVQV